MINFLLVISDESDHDKVLYLYNNFHDTMLKFARNKLKKVGSVNYYYDAEDAVQGAFVKITRYIKSIDFSVSDKELRAYVYSVVSNSINDLLNDIKVVDDIDEFCDLADDDSFIEQIHIKEQYNYVVKTIENMDEKYSTTLLYRYCQDMSVADIALLLGIAEKTVYKRIARGKQLLLNLIEEGVN